ncbi:MAG: IclR family transcriptional regulator [Austwickia sp.]|jgi:IclR family acetate operon transcriptional repressor|nr:MAG: IclR family transcriptional regulator [Austwickia sp.]
MAPPPPPGPWARAAVGERRRPGDRAALGDFGERGERARVASSKGLGAAAQRGVQRHLSDIARVTALPVSTTHRILQELVALGWAREAGGRYSLGARVLALSSRSTGGAELARLARPALRDLAAQTGRTVHFAMTDGDQLVYLDKIEGRGSYAMKSRVGMAIPMHCTSIGKAVLAAMSDTDVRALAARTGLPAATPRTFTDTGELLRHLQKVRARRYAVDDEENEPHTRCVGAAVLDHRGEPVAGVSVSSLAFDLSGADAADIAPLVVACADRISASFTATGEPA